MAVQNIQVKWLSDVADLDKTKDVLAGLTQEERELVAQAEKANQTFGQQKKTIQQLESRMEQLQAASKKATDPKERARLNAEIKKTEGLLDKVSNGQKKQLGLIQRLQKEEAQLKRLRDESNDPRQIAAYNKRLGETQKRMNELQTRGNKASGGIGKLTGALKGAAAAAGIAFAADQALQYAQQIAEITREVDKLRGKTRLLFEGEDENQLVVQAQAIADTWNVEVNDVLLRANTLQENFGKTGAESLGIIRKGFEAGANESGELLQNIAEYSSQIADAGGEAEDLVSIVATSTLGGIFSDKGIDAVKEFGLSIREQTKITREALVNGLGADFANQFLDDVNTGKLGTLEALKVLRDELKTTGLTASQQQTIIADTFKGAGEDAGLENFLKALDAAEVGLDTLAEKGKEARPAMVGLFEANEDLAEATGNLTTAVSGGGTAFQAFSTRAKAFLFNVLAGIIEGFKTLFKPLQDVGRYFIRLAENFGFVNDKGEETFSVMDSVKRAVEASLGPFRALIRLAVGISNRFLDLLENIPGVSTAFDFVGKAVTGLQDAMRELPAVVDGVLASMDELFSRAARLDFENIGDAAGEAFTDAYNKSLKKLKAPDPPPPDEDKLKQEIEEAKERARREKEEREQLQKDALNAEKELSEKLFSLRQKREAESLDAQLQIKREALDREFQEEKVKLQNTKAYTKQAEKDKLAALAQLQENYQNQLDGLEQEGRERRAAQAIEAIEREGEQKRLALAQSVANREMTAQEMNDRLAALEIGLSKRRLAVLREYGLDAQEEELRLSEARIAANERGQEKVLQAMSRMADAQRVELKRQLDAGLIDREEYNRQMLKKEIELGERKLEYLKQNGEDTLAVEEEILDKRAQLREMKEDEEEGRRQERVDKAVAATRQVGELTTEVLDFIDQKRQAKFQQELQRVQRQKEANIQALDEQLEANVISQETYDQRKKEIEEAAAIREKKLKREEFEAEKRSSIIRAGIQNALAIVNALASVPFPANLAAAAVTAAAGAVQIAAIASQPTPQFAEGVINLQGPGTETSDSIPARLSRGESVMTAKETKEYRPTLEAIRAKTIDPAVLNSLVVGDSGRSAGTGPIIVDTSDVAKELRNQPKDVHNITMDSKGFSHYIQKEGKRIKDISSQYRSKR